MKLFGNTGTGQRARQTAPFKAVNEVMPEENVLNETEVPLPDLLIFDDAPKQTLQKTPAGEAAGMIPESSDPIEQAPVFILPNPDEEAVPSDPAPEVKVPAIAYAVERKPRREKPEKSAKEKPEKVRKERPVKQKAEKDDPKEEKASGNRGIIKGIILLACSLAIFLITAFSVFAYLLKSDVSAGTSSQNETSSKPAINTEAVSPTTIEIDDTLKASAPSSETEGVYNLLIVGIDDDDKYTDTVMVLHMDANSHQLSALSLPHNTLVYGDYDVPMIDEVYHNSGKGADGIEALEQKLRTMFGFPMDCRIILTSESFSKLMDCLGTISFDVPETLASGLEKGTQELDAKGAAELLQTKDFSNDSIRRERVQLDFLQALGTQKLSALSQTELQILADALAGIFDSDLTGENLLYLLTEFQNCDFTNLKTYLMPGRIIKYYNRDYHQLDETAMLAILNMSFNPYDEDIDEDNVEIRTEKETDVPQSDYIREQQAQANNDDDNDDDNNGGGYYYGGDSDNDDNEPDQVEQTPEPDPEPGPEPEPDNNNPDEP